MNGQQFKKVREIIGISNKELSKKSGVGIRAIKSYEGGWNNINNASVTRVLKISKALGVEITDILDIDDF